jgi:hypothetical protein
MEGGEQSYLHVNGDSSSAHSMRGQLHPRTDIVVAYLNKVHKMKAWGNHIHYSIPWTKQILMEFDTERSVLNLWGKFNFCLYE